MRLMLFEHFRTARESLKRTRMRTLLTVTGVAIGVASITAILALGSGITTIIHRQVSDLGSNIAVIRPAAKDPSLGDLSSPTIQNTYTTSPLVERDISSLQKIPGIVATAPLMTLSGSVRSSDSEPRVSTILATTPSFAQTTHFDMLDGQFLDDVTLEDTTVIGQQLAVDLFGTDQAVGKNFLIKGQRFTVIGVIKRQNNPVNFNNLDLDHLAIISFDSGKLFNSGIAQIQQINLKTSDSTDVTSLKPVIEKTLKANHDNEADTTVLVGKEIAVPSNRTFVIINVIMSLIAAISLVVGGIGIMNIMLVSVVERTREIGLRKAVGATSGSIVAQFMIEAIIISLVGGALGYLGGYLIAFFVSLLLPYDPIITWQIAALAFGLAISVGTIFGVYPALKAAKKSPIESLRRLH